MRIAAIIGAVLVQVGILAYMGGHREYILSTGKTVYLRTAPVDPQDAFRGDYVRLDYEISNVGHDLMRDGLKKQARHGTQVYAVLDIGEDRVGQVQYITDVKPDNGLFIRGRIDDRWGNFIAPPVKYGIEAYFVEQGKGQAIEKLRGTRGGIQVPLEMETALGADGTAVLKGYRTGKLGIGLEIKTDPADRNRRVQGAKLKLKNVSDGPLAIIDLPEARSFSLVQDRRWIGPGMPVWEWVNQDSPRKNVENSDVRVLQSGEIYELAVDFRNPAWFVKKDKQSYAINDPNVGWNNFRLVYQPPSIEECKHLDKAGLVWHGYLRSSAFNSGGRID